MKKQKKEIQKGITLISLIITIIILLILAGVVLNLTLGEKGIFRLASLAGKNYMDAENKELDELEKLFSSILVAENGQITLTTEELNTYIDRKVEEKIQTTRDELNVTKTELEATKTSLAQIAQMVSDLNTTIASLQAKDTKLETSINNLENYTYTELANTNSTTEGHIENLKYNLINYKYVMIVYKTAEGNYYCSGMISVEFFKTMNKNFNVSSTDCAAISKYCSDDKVFLKVFKARDSYFLWDKIKFPQIIIKSAKKFHKK